MYAFRCKTCGHLHTAADAGEAAHPHACRVCGSGVVFGVGHEEFARRIVDPKLTHAERVAMTVQMAATATTKAVLPDNWESLADADDGRLKELGLAKGEVERHTPWPSTGGNNVPKHIAVIGADDVLHGDAVGAVVK